MSASPSLDESLLMAAVARHHFLMGESKIAIAERFGFSRFKVARLLELAVSTGLVRIEIAPAFGVDLDASIAVKERLGLARCTVLAVDPSSPENTLDGLGRIGAQVLDETLAPGDVLGLFWSRAVFAMTRRLQRLPLVRVVQLSGAIEVEGVDASAVDLVRSTARVSGTSPSIFHAPFVLDDAEAARAVRRQPSVVAGLGAVTEVTHAVMGIGAWAPGCSTIFDHASERLREDATAAGVIGECGGVVFDEHGAGVDTEIAHRVITVAPAQLEAIPHTLGLAYGSRKAEAVRAAVRGGLVTGMVIDSSLATVLLAR
ncbi:MAG TPA: sugar-binding domain-containing protein [Ornithinimicrobium sp.]|uniref:sugar-binding transcriptional regulator n=1 Tax=Ornithinimicrobium sp. TaxID=1977084 RepID=UPI002B493674|nr:sugar-binding domain-containing protein [Ornithinimicrobium sp.]HKJ11191.1 sugar-binding domain-containing protein [Ornithinimicrobium sp.]